MIMADNTVALAKKDGAVYPTQWPFHPDQPYPEYLFGADCLSKKNEAYALVRESFRQLGLDAAHFGTKAWNPLQGLVSPGNTVLVKPNLVVHAHMKGGDVRCLVTHGSILRAILDYVFKALDGRGRVVVGDAPVLSTDFDRAVRVTGLAGVIQFYRQRISPEIELIDFRTVSGELDEHFHVVEWKETLGDPGGNVTFDLGKDSMLDPIAHLSHLLRIPHYRPGDTAPYHNEHSHKYVVPRSVVEADVIINVPKMKTHCKAGVTLALKNFVGIVGRRYCFANYRRGSVHRGGDEYPAPSLLKSVSDMLERRIDGRRGFWSRLTLSTLFRANEYLGRLLRVNGIRQGEWYGNDTVWRTILDLVRIARYGTGDEKLTTWPQRPILTVIDGVVAGEGDGPLQAKPKEAGCVLAALNPVAADAAAATLMGFDYQKIPVIRNAAALEKWPLFPGMLDDVKVVSQGKALSLDEIVGTNLVEKFKPSRGWLGHIELG